MNFSSGNRSRSRRRDRASDLDVLLEARARTRTRARASAPRWWVRPALWLVVLGALYLGGGVGLRLARERWLYRIERLALKRIEVARDGLLSEAEIRNIAGIEIGRNALTVDPFEVRERLRRHPRVEDAQIRLDFPDALHITVRERVPVARLMLPRLGAAETYLLVDDLGFVFLPFPRGAAPVDVIESEATLPTLLGLNAAGAVAGRALTDAQSLDALRFLAAFDDSPLVVDADVINVDVGASPVLTVLTRGGAHVTLAADREFGEQLEKWHSVHQYSGGSNGLLIASLDLSITNNPPLRWVDASQPQPATPEPTPRPSRPKRKPPRRHV
ncbi:MAG: FtsQ-type POTRA domain-containing protein [Verrucomicrobiae bacterium]|nr:FtsQ-type POTRA domain-containing protein [Verrucomicrobiae bacterium]